MTYRLSWTRNAKSALARAWLQAVDRNAVAAAQISIDRLLGSDPLRHRIAVREGLYAIEVHPLRALFEIDSTRRRVRVVGVGLLP
jgi:hypothetical protein